MKLPQLPMQSVPPLDDRGGDTSLPPLFSRVWWLFLGAVVTALGSLSEAADSLKGGIAGLTHPGAIPKVSTAGVLTESALTDDGTAVTALARNLAITGAAPAYKASVTGGTQPARMQEYSDGACVWSTNLSYDGAAWNLDDTSKYGISVRLLTFGLPAVANYTGLVLLVAAPGANPATLVRKLQLSPEGNFDAGGVFKVAGTQVVGAQQAAIAAPTISTSNTASSAGATYTATEQGMLNALKTGLGAANTDITNLQTTVNSLRAVLTAHGLTL